MKKPLLLLLLLPLLTASCRKLVFGDDPAADPHAVFDAFTTTVKEHYGLFAVKPIDWDSLTAAHAPRISAGMSEADLYQVLVDMLSPLRDPHITLYPAGTELPRWSIDLVDGAYIDETFHFPTVRDHYLSRYRKVNDAVEYGWLDGEIGYIHIQSFDGAPNDYKKGLRDAVKDLAGCPGLVVDVRDNAGGFDALAQYSAGLFSTQEAVYMRVRRKVGPAPDQFGPEVWWSTSPTFPAFARTVVLLTGRGTQSAAETFSLALRTQAHVVHVGDTTAGAFADNAFFELPNGWGITLSIADHRDADNISWEGRGLPPAIHAVASRQQLNAGTDAALEAAMAQMP